MRTLHLQSLRWRQSHAPLDSHPFEDEDSGFAVFETVDSASFGPLRRSALERWCALELSPGVKSWSKGGLRQSKALWLPVASHADWKAGYIPLRKSIKATSPNVTSGKKNANKSQEEKSKSGTVM
jgi:hypothetical protein